jgi:hypothetical protein
MKINRKNDRMVRGASSVCELSIDRDLLGQEIGASTSNFLLIPRGSPTCYLAVRVSVQFPFGLHLLFLQTGLITTCEISSALADCCGTTREGLLTQLLATWLKIALVAASWYFCTVKDREQHTAASTWLATPYQRLHVLMHFTTLFVPEPVNTI